MGVILQGLLKNREDDAGRVCKRWQEVLGFYGAQQKLSTLDLDPYEIEWVRLQIL